MRHWFLSVLLMLPMLTRAAEPANWRELPLRPADATYQPIAPKDLDELRTLLRKAVDSRQVPGVGLLLAHKGQIIFREAFGDVAVDRPALLTSSSAPMVGSAVMILVDQGKLSLDDPISKYVPQFANTPAHKATVRQLLCHTSGIMGTYPGGRPRSGTLAEFARMIAANGTIRPPGQFSYSPVGLDIACRVAEAASGIPFEQYIKQSLWQPLNMNRTSFVLGADSATVPADAAARGEGRYVSGSEGIASSLDDVAAFYQMHLCGGTYAGAPVLSAASVAQMHAEHAVHTRRLNDPYGGEEYGLTFYRDRVAKDGAALTISHGGILGSYPWADLDRDLVGVLLTQAPLAAARPLILDVIARVRRWIPAEKPVEERPKPIAGPGETVPVTRVGDPEMRFKQIAGGGDRISRDQFKQYLNEYAPAGRLRESPMMADRLFDRLDSNGDGMLSLDEFKRTSDLRNPRAKQ